MAGGLLKTLLSLRYRHGALISSSQDLCLSLTVKLGRSRQAEGIRQPALQLATKRHDKT